MQQKTIMLKLMLLPKQPRQMLVSIHVVGNVRFNSDWHKGQHFKCVFSISTTGLASITTCVGGGLLLFFFVEEFVVSAVIDDTVLSSSSLVVNNSHLPPLRVLVESTTEPPPPGRFQSFSQLVSFCTTLKAGC